VFGVFGIAGASKINMNPYAIAMIPIISPIITKIFIKRFELNELNTSQTIRNVNIAVAITAGMTQMLLERFHAFFTLQIADPKQPISIKIINEYKIYNEISSINDSIFVLFIILGITRSVIHIVIIAKTATDGTHQLFFIVAEYSYTVYNYNFLKLRHNT